MIPCRSGSTCVFGRCADPEVAGTPVITAPATATFRGEIVALDALMGAILWQTYSLPDNGGLPGGSKTGQFIWNALVGPLLSSRHG